MLGGSLSQLTRCFFDATACTSEDQAAACAHLATANRRRGRQVDVRYVRPSGAGRRSAIVDESRQRILHARQPTTGPVTMEIGQPPFVSIVTPVFNGERHLCECIDSVRAQTYPHWDHTIVDNCSTDRTLEIAQKYAAADSRIRVQSNETFVQVIANYNIAVRQISPGATYCKVLAADDWLFPECLEKMVRLAEANPTVVIVGSYGLGSMGNVRCQGLPYPSTRVSGRDVCRRLLMGGPHVFGSPTSVLYRASILRTRSEFFNESNLHADTEACLEFLQHADFGFVHQILHYRRAHEDSLSAYSRRTNTYLPDKLRRLDSYGRKYLTDAEMARATRQCLRDYYCYLGNQFFRSRGREFWNYHSDTLAAIGHPLSTPRLLRAAIATAAKLVLDPSRALPAAARRIHR